jgi:hypothetical protein
MMNMKMETPAATVVALSAERKIGDIKQNFWFRAGVFALSVAGGVLFARLLHMGFTVLPTFGNGAQNKVGPVLTILRILRSGLGN